MWRRVVNVNDEAAAAAADDDNDDDDDDDECGKWKHRSKAIYLRNNSAKCQ